MNEPLYSVGTWDADLQAFTEQAGLTVPSQNIPWRGLLQVYRELRKMNYGCYRKRDEYGEHSWNDWSVLIERTDGKPLNGKR